MCSRGVWQLQKLTLRYHWHRGASAGWRCVLRDEANRGRERHSPCGTWVTCVRGFVQEHIIPFAKDNAQVKIETLATRGHPNVTAEYRTCASLLCVCRFVTRDACARRGAAHAVNGRSKVLNLANKSPT